MTSRSAAGSTHRTAGSIGRACSVGLAAWLSLAAPAVDVPPRSPGGQALVVPPAELALGEVYHVQPGEDAQLTFTSDAPLQRTIVTCRRVVGYLVLDYEYESAESPLRAGALRIPIPALRSGSESLDETLRSPAQLDAAQFPEATFRLTAARHARRAGDAGIAFSLTLLGELTLKGTTLPIEAPATLTILPFTWRSMMGRAPGDFATLRTSFELALADLGLTRPDPNAAVRMAERIRVDVFLVSNTVSPEKCYDPRIASAANQTYHQFTTLARDFGKLDEAYALARRAAEQELAGDAPSLERLARAIVAEDGLARRDLDLALTLAQRAVELSARGDVPALEALALVRYERREPDDAVRVQQEAVSLAEQRTPAAVEGLRQALARYQAARLPRTP